MLNSFVKTVFLAMMGAVLAYILFVVFFGNRVRLFGGNVAGDWDGVLHYAALAMEEPIAKYYYDNCYLPTAHQNDGVDIALGYQVVTDYNNTDLPRGYLATEATNYGKEIAEDYTMNNAVVQVHWTDNTKTSSGWY